MRTTAAALGVVVVLLAHGVARADDEADRGQARDLGTKAYAASEAGDWAKAEDLFRRADQLYHAPTLLLGLARARAHLGKYVEAWEDYHRILIETLPPNASPALRKAVDDAKAEIGSVEGKRAHVTITVAGATSPTVSLDGVPVSAAALGNERNVNPGSHTLHVEAAGMKPSDTTFTVTEGGTTTAAVTLQPAEPGSAPPPAAAPGAPSPTNPAAVPPPAEGGGGGTMRTVGIVGMAVGGAGLVTGIITGVVAMGQHSSLTSNSCASGGCNASDLASYQSSVSSFHTMGTISTIGFIAGPILAAGGAVLFFTAPRSDSTTGRLTVSPYVGAASAGVVGSF